MKKLGEKILWSRAEDYIQRYKPELIGVTGSFGKTLAKDAIALALSAERHVRASKESYNTPMGLALSALGMESAKDRMGWIRLLIGSRKKEFAEAEPDTLVLELGADRPGDIDFFASKLPFRIGVITHIGSTHLDRFVTKEMVAHEKMSLVVSLPRDGVAVLNADEPLIMQMKEYIRDAKIVTFGESPDADIRLVRAERLGVKGFVMEVSISGHSYEVPIPYIIARHQLSAPLAALAVAHAMKISMSKAITALRRLQSPQGRMQLLEGRKGATVIDDSYNASPESVMAALRTVEALPAVGRKILILGDMLSLGHHSINAHKQIGEKAAAVADVFVAVGEEMRHAQGVALRSDQRIDTHHFKTSKDVGKWMADHIRSGDLILVKGSRNMHMEHVVERLTVGK